MQNQDSLGAEDKAKEIKKDIQLLLSKKEGGKQEPEYKYSKKPSNMYAIYGGWGTGKTRLLEELKIIIEKNYKVVWFRPWEYFEESQNIDKKLLSILLDNNKGGKWVYLSLILFVILTIFTIGNMQWFQANIWQNFIAWNWIQYLILILVISGVITFILSKFNLIQYISSLAMGLVSFDITKLFSKLRDYTESSEDIQKEISNKIEKQTIVFVDDLDRCCKETVVEVLEHIKHFYASDKLFFIFAIDRKSLATYIAEHYNYQKETGEIDFDRGYQYLDKLFPDSYNLRYLDGRKLFNQYLEDNKIYDELTDTDRENYYLLVEYYAIFNWRKVEALIKKFAEIYKKIEYAKVVLYDDGSNVLYLDQIFRWCLLHEFYPEVFEERNWRKVVIEKFYTDKKLVCNLFKDQVFIGGNSNQYLTPITEEKNETFHLEKLYNYAGGFETYPEIVGYQIINPDGNPSGQWFRLEDNLNKNIKTIIRTRDMNWGWSREDREGSELTSSTKEIIKVKIKEYLETLIRMYKFTEIEEFSNSNSNRKKDLEGTGTIKIAKMNE